jgi:hypothetical protein
MICALLTEGYHRYECGREDVYEATIWKIMQQGKQNAEGVKKVHRLALKVGFSILKIFLAGHSH